MSAHSISTDFIDSSHVFERFSQRRAAVLIGTVSAMLWSGISVLAVYLT